jgi:hypothetical protein
VRSRSGERSRCGRSDDGRAAARRDGPFNH